MAGDVAQFLQKKFLASLRDTESELSGAVLISYLRAIKDIVIAIDTRRLTEDYCRRFIYVLLDLTDAFTKCQVFSHEWKKHSHHKTHLIFNHLSLTKICFVRKMKKRLAAIKGIFEDEFMKMEERIYNLRESSSRPDPEENLESELPVLIDRGRKFEAEGVGFDEQLRKIWNFLLKSSPSSGAGFAAVGILGMAGAGKTTLVREFLSWWIVQGEFSPIIWLCLSNIIKENKQVEEEIEVSIVKCMLSKLDHDAVADGDGIIQEEEKIISSNNNSGHLLAALLERLNQHLSDKRYLIVLDDVWHMNDFYSDLGHRQQLLQVQEGDKKIGDRLSHGLPKGTGGVVIVTSRIPEVVEAMVVPAEGSDQHYNSLIIPLEPLDRQNCWDIFKYTVFGYIPDFEYQQHLEKVESEIKDLCCGLPLAARTLAGIMSQNPQNLGRTSPPYRKSEELLKLPDLDVDPDSFHIKKSPVLVFIDMIDRQQGEELIGKFCDLLTKKQVFFSLNNEL
ncbi:probable disease resistance protein At4g19060 [Prunus avium]|uniref:Probable disease resistance protein At4g19060 n=1 Tax=Prunus avium TaxID=42229 RepID=A0A6P5SDX0_PRUAV|nr:probable disease resistance protein At4g19060 [Prunus avium]